jgi:hypothetical protein
MSEEFTKELEALYIKHNVEEGVLILPAGEQTKIITYHSTDSNMEPIVGNAYSRLAQFLGELTHTKIDELVDYLNEQFAEMLDESEESMSQVTWEKLAYTKAELVFSPEQLVELILAKEKKENAMSNGKWNDAAEWRENELELLKRAMDIE